MRSCQGNKESYTVCFLTVENIWNTLLKRGRIEFAKLNLRRKLFNFQLCFFFFFSFLQLSKTDPRLVSDFVSSYLGIITRPFRFSDFGHWWSETLWSCSSAATGNLGRWEATDEVIGREVEGGATDENTKWQHQRHLWAETRLLKWEHSGWMTVVRVRNISKQHDLTWSNIWWQIRGNLWLLQIYF